MTEHSPAYFGWFVALAVGDGVDVATGVLPGCRSCSSNRQPAIDVHIRNVPGADGWLCCRFWLLAMYFHVMAATRARSVSAWIVLPRDEDVTAVLGAPAASSHVPRTHHQRPGEATPTAWVIGLRAFGRLGRFLAGCASRVGSVGGVVDGRAQPAERLPRAPLVGSTVIVAASSSSSIRSTVVTVRS